MTSWWPQARRQWNVCPRVLLSILYQNEKHKYWCNVTKDTIQDQLEQHEKDGFTFWLGNKNKLETRSFKTILLLLCVAAQCCISTTLSYKAATKLSQNCTVEPMDKNCSTIAHSLANLNEKGRLMSLVSSDTSCCSHEHAPLSMFASASTLKSAVRTRRTFCQKIVNVFLCEELYREVLNLQKQLKQVSVGLDRLQADDTTVTPSVEMWFDLINSKELEPLKNKIKKLFKDAWKLSIW